MSELNLKEARKLTVELIKSQPGPYFKSLIFYFKSHDLSNVAKFISNPSAESTIKLDDETNNFIQNLLLLTAGDYKVYLDEDDAIISLKNLMKKTNYVIDPDQFWKRSRGMLKYAGEYHVDDYILKVETVRSWARRSSELGITDGALKSYVISSLNGKLNTLKDILSISKEKSLDEVLEIIKDYWYANRGRLTDQARNNNDHSRNNNNNFGKSNSNTYGQGNTNAGNKPNFTKSIGNIVFESDELASSPSTGSSNASSLSDRNYL